MPILRAGMRGAFGKPQGTCARVAIGQILLSIRCRDNHATVVRAFPACHAACRPLRSSSQQGQPA